MCIALSRGLDGADLAEVVLAPRGRRRGRVRQPTSECAPPGVVVFLACNIFGAFGTCQHFLIRHAFGNFGYESTSRDSQMVLVNLICLGAQARCNVREMKYTTGTGRTRIPIAQLLASLRFVHEAFFTSSELVATF